MEKQYIDMHIHTVNSDGRDTVEQVLERAQSLGLSLISITDHNTVNGYYHLKDCRNRFKGKIVPGVELSTTFNGELIEILGYGIDIDKINAFCQKSYLGFRGKQTKERLMILETYKKKGVVLDAHFCELMENDFEKLFNPDTHSSRTVFLNEIKRHPENARFFGGHEQMMSTSFKDYLRKHVAYPLSELYVDTRELFPTLEDTVAAIRDAGGYMFIAHCHLYSKEFNEALDGIVKKYKFDGLECYHSYFTKEQSEYTAGYCDKNNIWKSGGSDYHGGKRIDCVMGQSTEGMKLSTTLIQEWLKGIKAYV